MLDYWFILSCNRALCLWVGWATINTFSIVIRTYLDTFDWFLQLVVKFKTFFWLLVNTSLVIVCHPRLCRHDHSKYIHQHHYHSSTISFLCANISRNSKASNLNFWVQHRKERPLLLSSWAYFYIKILNSIKIVIFISSAITCIWFFLLYFSTKQIWTIKNYWLCSLLNCSAEMIMI